MGGHGAMYLSARHPELYCASGSMSGVMDINTATWKVPAAFAKSRTENFKHLLGPPTDPANPYREYSIVGMVDKLKANDVKLIFDCGFDDIMINTNRELHKLLVENGTPHDYIERPGKHEWPYWSNAVSYQFLFFQKVFQKQRSYTIKLYAISTGFFNHYCISGPYSYQKTFGADRVNHCACSVRIDRWLWVKRNWRNGDHRHQTGSTYRHLADICRIVFCCND